jgi:hypothetical protein
MVTISRVVEAPSVQDGPIKSLYILKNGLPVFTKEFSPALQAQDMQMLVSGFLTALTSFLKDMKDFGEMRSLTTSTNHRFNFYQSDGLLFVACTDGSVAEVDVDRFLRNTCAKFLQTYSQDKISSNMINTRHFQGFESIMQRDLMTHELRGISSAGEPPARAGGVPRMLVPVERVQREFHLGGEGMDTVLNYVDGRTGIGDIAKLVGMEAPKVTSYLRHMVKNGVVALS